MLADADIPPDDTLFLSLLMQPAWPFVLHQFILKAILFCHVRYEILRHINTRSITTSAFNPVPHQHLCSNRYFPSEPGWPGSTQFSSFLFHSFGKKTFTNRYHKFLEPDPFLVTQTTVVNPSRSPGTHSNTAALQSTDPNHRKSPTGLILPFVTTKLQRDGVLLCFHWLSNASTLTKSSHTILWQMNDGIPLNDFEV